MSDAIVKPEAQAMGFDLWGVAQRLASSQLIPRPLQRKPEDVLVVLMTGRELGLEAMQSLRSIHVIEGKGVCSADLLMGLCVRHRDVCEYFRLVESTDKRAAYETKRHGSEPVKLAFTIEDATRAGLLNKDNWKKYPQAMLRARCTAALARAVYPDLTSGIYTAEEAEEFAKPGQLVALNGEPPAPAPTAKEAAKAKAAAAVQVVDAKAALPEPREPTPLEKAEILLAESDKESFGATLEKVKLLCVGMGPLDVAGIRTAAAKRQAELGWKPPGKRGPIIDQEGDESEGEARARHLQDRMPPPIDDEAPADVYADQDTP